MKKKYWARIAARIAMPLTCMVWGLAALYGCQLENKADPDVVDALLNSTDFITGHQELETEVRDFVDQARSDAATSLGGAITWEEARPNSPTPEACCWSIGQNPLPTDLSGLYAQLAPDDEQVVNQWGDTCPPGNTVDNSNTSWWNSNYSRTTGFHSNRDSIDGGKHWITLDLGAVYNIAEFGYQGRSQQANSRINEYQLYVSETADLGRDAAAPLWNHSGHRPAAAKLVHQGNFSNNTNMQWVTLPEPAYGRYIQLRPLSGHAPDNVGVGAAELRVRRASTSGGANLGESVKAAVNQAIEDEGYGNLTIDDSNLRQAYQEGVRRLALAKTDPVKYIKLYAILNGSSAADGTVTVKGAMHYLNDENRPVITGSSSIAAFFAYQKEVDDLTVKLCSVMSSIVVN